MKKFIPFILLLPLVVFAGPTKKTVEVEICNPKFCFTSTVKNVVKTEKVLDMKDREYLRFVQSDGRITDLYVDGMTVKFLKGK